MTRPLVIQGIIGFLCAGLGLTILARPQAWRAMLRAEGSEGARYVLRIAGTMLLAAGLFLGGFAIAASQWIAP